MKKNIFHYFAAFDCCFLCDVMGNDEYKLYLDGIVAQLHDHYPYASFMVCNFRAGYQRSRISTLLSQYRMQVMDYPNQQGSVPLLPLQVISQFLISSESWLGQQNVMLMHCERGSLPLLDFMLSALLLYIDRYHGDQKTLELAYNQGSRELLRHASSLNPRPSQLRYLQYISTSSEWPSSEAPLLLDCLILKGLSHFEWRRDWRPSLRVFGQDPKPRACRSSILLFSTPNTDHMYQQVLFKPLYLCDIWINLYVYHTDLANVSSNVNLKCWFSFPVSNICELDTFINQRLKVKMLLY